MAQMVKRLPAMQETRVRFLGWEDPLEKEMATHSSTLAWKIPWMAEPGGLQSWGHKQSDTTERLHFSFAEVNESHSLSSVRLFGTPWAIQFLEFSRPEYWTG